MLNIFKRKDRKNKKKNYKIIIIGGKGTGMVRRFAKPISLEKD